MLDDRRDAAAPTTTAVSMGSREQQQQQPEGRVRFWHRDNFFVTNDKSYVDPHVFNASLDQQWWSSALDLEQVNKILQHCLTVGVYWTPQTEAEMKTSGIARPGDEGSQVKMVGFARVVTDYVTFAYLTDVFVVDDFQRRGLASWLMRAVKEIVDEWPDMRGLLLMTHDHAAARLYKRELGAVDFDQGPSAGLVVLEVPGPKEKAVPQGH